MRISLRSGALRIRPQALISGLVLSLMLVAQAEAATYYWVGTPASTNWSTTTNWNTDPKGGIITGTNAAPTVADNVILQNSGSMLGRNIILTASSLVNNLTMKSTWTGALQLGGFNVNAAGNVRMGSGYLIGNTGNLSVAGSFTQTGGIVRGLQGTLNLSGSLSVTRTTATVPSVFTSTGTLIFSGIADQTVTFDTTGVTRTLGAWTLNHRAKDGNYTVTVVGQPLRLSGALTINQGKLALNTNSIALSTRGNIVLANHESGALVTDSAITSSGSVTLGAASTFTMSAGTLTLDGVNQALSLNSNTVPTLAINSSGTATLGANLTVSTALSVGAGSTLNLSSYTLTATVATITNGGTLTYATGTLTHPATTFLMTDSSYNEMFGVSAGNTAYFTLTNSAANLDGTTPDTVAITVAMSTGDSETVTLTETGNATGIFRGSIVTAKQASGTAAGRLESDTDTIISVSYTEADTGSSNTYRGVFTAGGGTSTTSGGGGGGGRGSGGGTVSTPAVTTPANRTVSPTGKLTAAERREARLQARKAALLRRNARANARKARNR